MKLCCNTCERQKPATDFYRNNKTPTGRNPKCKLCCAARARATKRARREFYRDNPDDPVKIREMVRDLAAGAQRRARMAAVCKGDPELQAACRVFYQIAARVKKCCGIQLHVDHVIPLNGAAVSGLHVPWNLQLLPAAANLRKGNKVSWDAVETHDKMLEE